MLCFFGHQKGLHYYTNCKPEKTSPPILFPPLFLSYRIFLNREDPIQKKTRGKKEVSKGLACLAWVTTVGYRIWNNRMHVLNFNLLVNLNFLFIFFYLIGLIHNSCCRVGAWVLLFCINSGFFIVKQLALIHLLCHASSATKRIKRVSCLWLWTQCHPSHLPFLTCFGPLHLQLYYPNPFQSQLFVQDYPLSVRTCFSLMILITHFLLLIYYFILHFLTSLH